MLKKRFIQVSIISENSVFSRKVLIYSLSIYRTVKLSVSPFGTPCMNLCFFSSNIALQWTCMTGGRFCCCLVSCGLFHAKSDFPPMGGITTFAYFCSSSSSSIFPTFFNKKKYGRQFSQKMLQGKITRFFTPKKIPFATFLTL